MFHRFLPLFCIVIPVCSALLIASSQITSCVNDGSHATSLLSCNQKMVVALSVEAGQVSVVTLEKRLIYSSAEWNGIYHCRSRSKHRQWRYAIPAISVPNCGWEEQCGLELAPLCISRQAKKCGDASLILLDRE